MPPCSPLPPREREWLGWSREDKQVSPRPSMKSPEAWREGERVLHFLYFFKLQRWFSEMEKWVQFLDVLQVKKKKESNTEIARVNSKSKKRCRSPLCPCPSVLVHLPTGNTVKFDVCILPNLFPCICICTHTLTSHSQCFHYINVIIPYVLFCNILFHFIYLWRLSN